MSCTMFTFGLIAYNTHIDSINIIHLCSLLKGKSSSEKLDIMTPNFSCVFVYFFFLYGMTMVNVGHSSTDVDEKEVKIANQYGSAIKNSTGLQCEKSVKIIEEKFS